jgi:hypothetical protein
MAMAGPLPVALRSRSEARKMLRAACTIDPKKIRLPRIECQSARFILINRPVLAVSREQRVVSDADAFVRET